jgi:hypothetical protein
MAANKLAAKKEEILGIIAVRAFSVTNGSGPADLIWIIGNQIVPQQKAHPWTPLHLSSQLTRMGSAHDMIAGGSEKIIQKRREPNSP